MIAFAGATNELPAAGFGDAAFVGDVDGLYGDWVVGDVVGVAVVPARSATWSGRGPGPGRQGKGLLRPVARWRDDPFNCWASDPQPHIDRAL